MEEEQIFPNITNFGIGDGGNTHYVDIGEVKMGFTTDKLKISSLGSCIGLVMYPSDKKVNHCAIMGHIMLPKSKEKDRKPYSKSKWPLTRFADIAVPNMIEELGKAVGRARQKTIVAKMIGGAEMFGFTKLTYRIGKENARVTKALLKKHNIPLIKEFTGGDSGMSVDFKVSNYILRIKPTGGKSITI